MKRTVLLLIEGLKLKFEYEFFFLLNEILYGTISK